MWIRSTSEWLPTSWLPVGQAQAWTWPQLGRQRAGAALPSPTPAATPAAYQGLPWIPPEPHRSLAVVPCFGSKVLRRGSGECPSKPVRSRGGSRESISGAPIIGIWRHPCEGFIASNYNSGTYGAGEPFVKGLSLSNRCMNHRLEGNRLECALAQPFGFFPNPFTTPRIHSTLLRVFSSVPLHSMETTPSQPLRCR